MRKGKIAKVFFLVSYLVLFFLLVSTLSQPAIAQQTEVPDFDYINPIINAIPQNASAVAEIKKDVEFFSSLGSRFTSYTGCTAAAEYIAQKFATYGMNVEFLPYNVTLPVDEGAYIEFSTGKVKLYPLLPNLVCPPQTPPGGIEGKLIYVGDGDTSNFDGKAIEGNIVIMDFNSEYHWIKAANLGAKAVVFVEPSDTSVYEAALKTVDLAWNFPRLYVKAEDANKLFAQVGKQVKLVSNMKIETVQATNVVAYLPGQTNQSILLTAQYDSFSWVPSVAPGARESIGVSILFQLAKFFSTNPTLHRYTLVFIAFSGTDQGCIGSTWFMNEKIREDWDKWGKNVVLQINIAISDGQKTVMPTVIGGASIAYKNCPWAAPLRQWWLGTLQRDMADKMSMPEILVDQTYQKTKNTMVLRGEAFAESLGEVYAANWDLFGIPISYLNHEPLFALGGPALSFHDFLSYHKYWGTPLDLPDNIDWDSVEYKLKVICPLILATVKTDLVAKKLVWEPDVDWRPAESLKNYAYPWPLWMDMNGQVEQYNAGKAWYDPVPNAVIAYRNMIGKTTQTSASEGYAQGWQTGMGLDLWSYSYADEEGNVFIPCCSPSEIRVYVVNETTGMVSYAPAYGLHWYPTQIFSINDHQIASTVGMLLTLSTSKQYSFSVFTIKPVGNIVLFDIGDVYLRNTPRDLMLGLEPDSHTSKSILEDWSWECWLDGGLGLGVGILHVTPNEPVDIYMRTQWTLKYPLAFWVNASETNPEGSGYTAGLGEQVAITYSDLQGAENMYWFNHPRSFQLESYKIPIPAEADLVELIQESRNAKEEYNYSKCLALSQEALAKARDLYMTTRLTIEDSSLSTTFVGFILIPFIILAERLLVSKSGLKRVISILIFYVVPVLILWPIHPGFGLASNPLMVLIGFSVLILLFPSIGVIYFMAGNFLRKLRTKIFGVHISELPKSTVALISFSTGVGNMRKRPLRTGLLLISIVIISAASVVFTSVSAITVIRPIDLSNIGTYNGILIRQWDYGGLAGGAAIASMGMGPHTRGPKNTQTFPEVGERLFDELKFKYGYMAVFSPRAWAYVGDVSFRETYIANIDGVVLRKPTHVLLGLSPEEKEITINESRDIIAGRWFTTEDNDNKRSVTIISSEIANAFNITKSQVESTNPPELIWAGGYRFTVIGIINDTTFYQQDIDLDNFPITPLDLNALPTKVMVEPARTLIIPYKTLLCSVPASMISCAMKFKPEYATQENILRVATDIYDSVGIDIWASYNKHVYSLTQGSSINVMGWQYQLVPLVLAALTILNLLIGSIQERMNEIATYSVVGLSPFQLSFLFLAETLSYAVVGTVIGYIVGVAAGYLANTFNIGMVLNYYGTQVITSIIIIMCMTIFASVYPMIKVSRLVTPSLERKWSLPKPIGNVWQIPLPFVLASDTEALGLTNYILEFTEAHKVEDSEIFHALNVKYEESEIPEQAIKNITFECQLEPYELNIYQDVSCKMTKDMKTGYYSILLSLVLTRGSKSTWETYGRGFVDLFRKQLLIWRSFRAEERRKYQKKV